MDSLTTRTAITLTGEWATGLRLPTLKVERIRHSFTLQRLSTAHFIFYFVANRFSVAHSLPIFVAYTCQPENDLLVLYPVRCHVVRFPGGESTDLQWSVSWTIDEMRSEILSIVEPISADGSCRRHKIGMIEVYFVSCTFADHAAFEKCPVADCANCHAHSVCRPKVAARMIREMETFLSIGAANEVQK